MAYRSSVHESTRFTPQFRVFGQELRLPLDCMYPKPQEPETTAIHELEQDKQQAFQQTFAVIRHKLNEEKKTPKCHLLHGATYKEGEKVLLYHPTIAVGTTFKFASPWKGPYSIEKCLNDVTFRIMEQNSSKQKSVHYDRLKPRVEPPPTSSAPTGNKPRNFQSFQDIADTHKHLDGAFNHNDCLSFLPTPSSVFTPIPAVG